MGTDFQPYLETVIYELDCSNSNLSLHGNVQLERLNTTAIKRSYSTTENKKYFNK